MAKILVACQECKNRANPDVNACYRCGHAVTPEALEIGKRFERKITMLTLGFFMSFFIPFSLFLIFHGMKNSDIQGGKSSWEVALGIGLLLAAFAMTGYVGFHLFVKKK